MINPTSPWMLYPKTIRLLDLTKFFIINSTILIYMNTVFHNLWYFKLESRNFLCLHFLISSEPSLRDILSAISSLRACWVPSSRMDTGRQSWANHWRWECKNWLLKDIWAITQWRIKYIPAELRDRSKAMEMRPCKWL
jgi:hypothetical protein